MNLRPAKVRILAALGGVLTGGDSTGAIKTLGPHTSLWILLSYSSQPRFTNDPALEIYGEGRLPRLRTTAIEVVCLLVIGGGSSSLRAAACRHQNLTLVLTNGLAPATGAVLQCASVLTVRRAQRLPATIGLEVSSAAL